ncbi:MAG: hypothetical protein QME90_10650 [Thermodesulfobacteriota bacterium]|nr:hypothetical protein [Thermodesulfobacteriota bacterium]
MADLLAYPLKQEILIENGRISDVPDELFGKRVCEVIKKKYNMHFYNRRIYGYGKVFLK